jgi:thioredoxin
MDLSETVQALTAESWETEVLRASGTVLVDFWAEWCAPCRTLGPVVDALATEYAGRIKVGKLNVDAHGEVAERYGVRAIPTLLFFRDGQVVEQRVGALRADELRRVIETHVAEKVAPQP